MKVSHRGVTVALATFALAALAPRLALADEGEKNPAAFVLLSVTLVPLALVPLGLAFHLLLRALFPRRLRRVVHAIETRRMRAAAVGFLNALVLGLVVLGTGQKAPAIAHATLLALVTLSFVGLHGVARALGARALGATGAEPMGAARSELRELAVGWFVVSYVSCFPGLGWVLGAWWAVLGLGAFVVSLGGESEV